MAGIKSSLPGRDISLSLGRPHQVSNPPNDTTRRALGLVGAIHDERAGGLFDSHASQNRHVEIAKINCIVKGGADTLELGTLVCFSELKGAIKSGERRERGGRVKPNTEVLVDGSPCTDTSKISIAAPLAVEEFHVRGRPCSLSVAFVGTTELLLGKKALYNARGEPRQFVPPGTRLYVRAAAPNRILQLTMIADTQLTPDDYGDQRLVQIGTLAQPYIRGQSTILVIVQPKQLV